MSAAAARISLAAFAVLLAAAGASARQQCATPKLPQWQIFNAGTQPVAVAKADFNADGKLDVAVANNFSSEVSVLLGDGAGNFSAPAKFSIPAHPVAIVTNDFNNDGRADVAVAAFSGVQGDGSVSVLLGNGAGGFAAPVSFTVGQGPSSITSADFNGDGKADLAVGIQFTDMVTVVFGDGAGGFSGATSLNSGGTPRAVAAADLNGDGRPDLVAGNNGSNNASVFLNNGGGTFAAAVNYAVGTDPSAVAVGDLNGDGRADLAVANHTSAGSPGTVSVLLGSGAGAFGAATNYTVGIGPKDVIVGDFDRDGRADLAVANEYSHNVSILLGDGAGHFSTGRGYVAGTGPWSLAAGDFNRDGKLDIAALDSVKQSLLLLAGRGDGRFSTPPTYATNNGPMGVTTGDFNGDGKLDAAVSYFSFNPSTVALLLGDGRGGFTLSKSFDVGADPRVLTAADFNRDGKLDLVTVNWSSNKISVLLGTGTGDFAAARTFNTAANFSPRGMRVADLNGDGKLDLAVANYSFGSPNAPVSVLLGDGAGNFGAPTQYATGAADASDVAPGDFNGDGRVDLLVSNSGGSSVSLLLGDGAGAFGAPTNFTVGSSPRAVRVGDFDGDGKLDAAVANYGTPGAASSTVSVLIGNGAGGFAAPVNVTTGPELQQLTAADLNGDGKLDLVTSSTSFEMLVLQGDGAGNFSPAQTVPVSYNALAPGDVNGDGSQDILTVGTNQLTVLLNGCGAGATNPVNDSAFFVRQHYLDFLSREPDTNGFNFWVGEIESCGASAQCREVKRINVSAAFFLSIEFQQTGYLAYRAHKVAFGNLAGKPVPITREEMLADMRVIGKDVIVNTEGWELRLEQNKQTYFEQFVASPRFASLYPQSLTPEQFVDALNANSNGALSQAERDALVADLKNNAKTRAQVVRAVTEDADLTRAEFNKAFVLMEYFGYLRRDPDALPDTDFTGYNFWLTKLNQFNGDYIAAEMVKAFITSTEYINRFAQ
ncbi:MAG: VCBS repeat-containing protein [Acidobacteria bacterium]|nr:VCBS repeat-containing protein [Acidobacteriota bacterium]